ncbi:MAG: hypothetical protein R2712_19230 [Vicinamibacterales bacterium]
MSLARVAWRCCSAERCDRGRQAQGVVGLDRRVDPLDMAAARATVLIFTTTDCPISNRCARGGAHGHGLPQRGVRFVLVYPVPGDTPDKIRQHMTMFGYDLGVVRDTAFAGETHGRRCHAEEWPSWRRERHRSTRAASTTATWTSVSTVPAPTTRPRVP